MVIGEVKGGQGGGEEVLKEDVKGGLGGEEGEKKRRAAEGWRCGKRTDNMR